MPLSVLFADVRGYTSLTEGISPAEVPALMNRFYETASSALLSAEGLLGQVEGDNVMGLFVPGLAGKGYPRKAVEGAGALLRSVGYGSDEDNSRRICGSGRSSRLPVARTPLS